MVRCIRTFGRRCLSPALSDRLGWCVFLDTPAGKNAFYEVYQHAESVLDWFAATFKASEEKTVINRNMNVTGLPR